MNTNQENKVPRSREEIEQEIIISTGVKMWRRDEVILEVLLDIRDYLSSKEERVERNRAVDLGVGRACGTCDEQLCACPQRKSNGDWVESKEFFVPPEHKEEKLPTDKANMNYTGKLGDNTPKIEIVTSPRLDWCERCEKEHGYICPLDYEKEQEGKIYEVLYKLCANKNYIDCAYEDIKSLLSKTKEEEKRRVKNIISNLKVDAEFTQVGEGYNLCIKDLLSALDE